MAQRLNLIQQTKEIAQKLRQGLRPMEKSVRGRMVLAGVSGGADSVCLLALLAEARRELRFELAAVHVNHGLRGAESDRDERFVADLCRKLGVRFRRFRAGRMLQGKGEREARDFRRACFVQACRDFGSRDVFLAHQQDDQAETVLFNLIRGTGLSGAAGLRPVAPLASGVRVVRPLLGISAVEIRIYLRSRGWAWREDSTNQKLLLSRNVLRHAVFPALESAHPGAVRHLAQFTGRVEKVQAWLERQAAVGLKSASVRRGLSLAKLGRMEPFLRNQVLRLAARKVRGLGQGLDEQATGRLENLLALGRGRCDLLRGQSAFISKGKLLFGRVDKSMVR
jgi:tRNA(Ile)-lysidine synthase